MTPRCFPLVLAVLLFGSPATARVEPFPVGFQVREIATNGTTELLASTTRSRRASANGCRTS